MANETLVCAASLVGAYLVGGIPFGFLIGKMRGVDVRTKGSRNIGATNVFRTVGKGWGLLAFALDVLKGLLPTLAAIRLGGAAYLPLGVGLACVVGHMLTPYMGFRGGKGVATAFGMLIALLPAHVGCAFAVFALVFALSHYISLGSCSAAATLALLVWMPVFGRARWGEDLPLSALVTLIALFIIWKHRSNLARLAHGTENKIYLFKERHA